MNKKTTLKTTKWKRAKKVNDLPFLIVRLGDKEKGWIPSIEHQTAFSEIAHSMGLDQKFNIIIYHYAIEFEILDKRNTLKDYGLQIVDIDAFNKFIDETNKDKKVLQDYYRDEILKILEEDIKEKKEKLVKQKKTNLRKNKKEDK